MSERTSAQEQDVFQDVVIAGGGPAGLSAARKLAEAGHAVTVLERSAEIGMPVHTSGASWVREMRAFDVPPSLYRPIPKLRVLGPGSQAFFHWQEPTGCIVDVRGLYQHLAERAVVAGARLFVGAEAGAPLVSQGGRVEGVRVRGRGRPDRRFRARVTIDATGFAAHLARRLGVHEGARRYGIGAEYDLYAPHADSNEVLVWVGSRTAPSGYGWVAPYAERRVRVGVGVLRPDTRAHPSELLERAMAGLPALRHVLRDASPIESHFGYIPSQGIYPETTRDGFLCVGDAAGHPSALLGEGIRFALHSGELAGSCVARALVSGEPDARRLEAFPKAFDRRFGRALRRAARLNRWLGAISDESWDLGVEALSRLRPDQAAALLRGEGRPLGSVAWHGVTTPSLRRRLLVHARARMAARLRSPERAAARPA